MTDYFPVRDGIRHCESVALPAIAADLDIAATVLGIFFVPLFYVVIKRIFPDKPKDAAVGPTAQEGR